MAQLLLIKDANTAQKEVDDIIGFFEDTHKFSNDEKIAFNIQQVKGYTREELTVFAQNKNPQRKRIWKALTTGWVDNVEKKIAWKHMDDKWYFLEAEPKYYFTIKNMTTQEKETLDSDSSTSFDKLTALAHLENKMSMYPVNMSEVTDLNK